MKIYMESGRVFAEAESVADVSKLLSFKKAEKEEVRGGCRSKDASKA